jgi:hypothetical protein
MSSVQFDLLDTGGTYSLVSGSLMFGPGADRKYRSEEEGRQEEEARRRSKRRQIVGGGLAAGLLLGAYWAVASRRNKANNMQIRQDDTRQNSKLNYLIIGTF